jgi:hypothetical protein
VDKTQLITFAVVLLFGFSAVMSTKLWYTGETTPIETESEPTHLYPYHVDEWQHLALSEYALEEKSLPIVNPYIESQPEKYNFEIGFTILNALLIGALPIASVHLYAFLPGLVMSLSMAALFYCLRARVGFKESIFSSLLLIFIPSNINLTGFWFYTPLSASIPLIFLTIGLYLRSKLTLRLLASSFFLLIVYPPGFFLSFFIVSIYEILSYNNVRRYLFAGLILTVILLTFLLSTFTVFSSSWQKTFAVTYNPFILFGSLLTFLSAVGAMREYRNLEMTWLVWPAITGMLLLLYHVVNATVLIPYPRVLYYFLIGLVPLAGLGLHEIDKHVSWLKPAFTGTLVALILLFSYHSIDDTRFRFQDFFSEEDMQVLHQLKDEPGTSKVLSNPHLASTIYPITGNHVPALPDSLLKYGDPRLYTRFLRAGCSGKQRIIEEEQIDYVITQERVECAGFSTEAHNGKFLYEIQ